MIDTREEEIKGSLKMYKLRAQKRRKLSILGALSFLQNLNIRVKFEFVQNLGSGSKCVIIMRIEEHGRRENWRESESQKFVARQIQNSDIYIHTALSYYVKIYI